MLKDGGTASRAAVETAIRELGGKLEIMYFVWGQQDVVVIADLPDSASATAFALAANTAGTAQTHTTPLMTPEEIDQAVGKSVKYRPPGAAGSSRQG